MKVNGELEVAQLERFTNAGKPAASSYAGRIIFVTDLTQIQVSDGSVWQAYSAASSSRLSSMYDIVIGTAAQVTSGVATHSTWSAATAAMTAGMNVFVLEGTWAESPTISVQVNITGCGYNSFLNGTLTNSASGVGVFGLRLPLAASWVDNGTAGSNFFQGWAT